MSFLSFVISHPDDVITVVGLIAALFGLNKVVKKRAALKSEIDRWASTAAGFVVMLVKQGAITDHDGAIDRGLERFHTLANSFGVEVSPEHEVRALSVINDAVTAAGVAAMGEALADLSKAADAAIKRMTAASTTLKVPSTRVAPTTVTVVK